MASEKPAAVTHRQHVTGKKKQVKCRADKCFRLYFTCFLFMYLFMNLYRKYSVIYIQYCLLIYSLLMFFDVF